MSNNNKVYFQINISQHKETHSLVFFLINEENLFIIKYKHNLLF